MPTLIASDGARVHYKADGAGELVVVCLHCLGGNAETWRPLWRAWRGAEVRWVALDFRGTGASERAPCELTNERLAADVLEVADAMGLGRFVVLGHSMGAKVGWYVALRASERVQALVMLGAPSPGLVPMDRGVLEEFLARPDDRQFVEDFYRPWFTIWPRPEIEAWIDSFMAMPEWALRATCELSLWTSFAEAARRWEGPTLNVVGEQDPVYGPAYQETAVRPYAPQAEEVRVACGHGFMWEQPEVVAEVVGVFLERDGSERRG